MIMRLIFVVKPRQILIGDHNIGFCGELTEIMSGLTSKSLLVWLFNADDYLMIPEKYYSLCHKLFQSFIYFCSVLFHFTRVTLNQRKWIFSVIPYSYNCNNQKQLSHPFICPHDDSQGGIMFYPYFCMQYFSKIFRRNRRFHHQIQKLTNSADPGSSPFHVTFLSE